MKQLNLKKGLPYGILLLIFLLLPLALNTSYWIGVLIMVLYKVVGSVSLRTISLSGTLTFAHGAFIALGAAHTSSGLAGDHPVGQVALSVNLVCAQNGSINVATADKAEGTEAVEAGAANAQNRGLTASVYHVGICILALLGSASQTNNTILGVNPNVHTLGQVVQALGGHTDAQVYNVAVLEQTSSSVSNQVLTCKFHSIHLQVPP